MVGAHLLKIFDVTWNVGIFVSSDTPVMAYKTQQMQKITGIPRSFSLYDRNLAFEYRFQTIFKRLANENKYETFN